MYRRLLAHSLVGLGLTFSLGACVAPDLSQPCPIPPDVTDPNDPRYQAALNKCFPAMSAQPFDTRLKKDIDILFMIDSSSSMSPKQKQLAKAIPGFIRQIDDTGANYHVGVITSDIGTLPPGSGMFPGQNDPICGTPKGDDGLLQNIPCTSRPGNLADTNQEFRKACAELCPDPAFVPKDRWISKENGITNVPAGPVVNGKDTGPQLAFQCIGLVGDGGCGVEGQLEATRRALDGHLTENSGFLRDNSVLAVIFITDEDDCSVQLSQRSNLNPAFNACSTVNNPDPDYKCYNLDYRCIAKDVECFTDPEMTQPDSLAVPGAKKYCRERANTWLEPIEKYARFFSTLRPADKLVLAGIWAPSILDYNAGNATSLGTGQLVVASQAPPDTSTNNMNRGQRMSAACFNPDTTLTLDTARGYFGQAQIRLEMFKNRFDPNIWSEQSICDVNNYQAILTKIATRISASISDCLGVKPNVDSNGNPACLVGFVDGNQPDSLPDTYLPVCSSTCCNAWAQSKQPIGPYGPGSPPTIAKDPAIVAACQGETTDACYCAVPSTASPTPLCQGTAVAGVWRPNDAPPPPGKVVSFRCAGTRPPVPPTM